MLSLFDVGFLVQVLFRVYFVLWITFSAGVDFLHCIARLEFDSMSVFEGSWDGHT
jgi:hypothetical protein